MSNLDPQLINRKAQLILADLEELKKATLMSEGEYLNSYEDQLQIERLLEKIIGRIIDINYHILKEKYSMVPSDYYSSFIEMGRKNEIDDETVKNLSLSAGLRNILAHEYDTIDASLVYQSIPQILKYVPEYLKQVAA